MYNDNILQTFFGGGDGGLMTSVSLILWLLPCLTSDRFYTCACFSYSIATNAPLSSTFKVGVYMKRWRSGFMALLVITFWLDKTVNSRHETTEEGFQTTITMQENIRFYFLLGLFHTCVFISWQTRGQCCMNKIQWMPCLDRCTCYL